MRRGRLCANGHDDGTGHSVRWLCNHTCIACAAAATSRSARRSDHPIAFDAIAAALHDERLRQGVSLQTLAGLLGTGTVSWLGALEHGKRRASVDMLERIADALDLDLVITARLVRRPP